MSFQGALAPAWAFLAAIGTRLFYAMLGSTLSRDILQAALKAGSGPSEESMNNGYFRCRVWVKTRVGRVLRSPFAVKVILRIASRCSAFVKALLRWCSTWTSFQKAPVSSLQVPASEMRLSPDC